MRFVGQSLLVGVVAVAGAGAASETDAARFGDAGVASTSVSASTTVAPSRLASAIAAVRLAGRQVRGGRPYDVEDERFRGRIVWEVEVAAGTQRPHVFLVSANGKQVVRRALARRLGDDARRVLRARVTLAQALRIAGRRASGRFSEAEIDDARGGAIVWEASFNRPGNVETEVVVDARTGRVLRVTTDD
ncbi:PepSY domain-containing protein [Gaiella sp.]|jgi:uncharacterized membrane protein YkoI|uniref:PepSY domain-containing protein n=1 Tax=Gaiella sp. TaxID=2663207 RepID=UPI002E33CAD6|nr:PepSY domain-containing protein [Gaiella sp.]HEX5582630.1 PepSY domain-containing protein [Gaiella sp.]